MNTQDIITELESLGVPSYDAQTLAAVGYAESGYQTGIVGDKQYGNSVGLFQINLPSHADKLQNWTGSTNQDDWISWLSDPLNNIKAAAQVYFSQGLGAWTQFRNGAYLPYLNQSYTVQGGETTPPGTPTNNPNWRPAEVPADAPDPSQPYWKRWLYYNKLIFTGNIKAAEAYRGTWTVDYTDTKTGRPGTTTESQIRQEAGNKVAQTNSLILGKVQQGFVLVAGLAIAILGAVFMARQEAEEIVKKEVGIGAKT